MSPEQSHNLVGSITEGFSPDASRECVQDELWWQLNTLVEENAITPEEAVECWDDYLNSIGEIA